MKNQLLNNQFALYVLVILPIIFSFVLFLEFNLPTGYTNEFVITSEIEKIGNNEYEYTISTRNTRFKSKNEIFKGAQRMDPIEIWFTPVFHRISEVHFKGKVVEQSSILNLFNSLIPSINVVLSLFLISILIKGNLPNPYLAIGNFVLSLALFIVLGLRLGV